MMYSYNNLNKIINSIVRLLQRSQQQDYNRKLIYLLNKNLRKIQEESELLEEQLKDMPDGWDSYQQKLQRLAIESGGEIKNTPDGNGTYVDLKVEGFDEKGFQQSVKELKDDNKEMIEKVGEINKVNEEFKKEKIAEIEWNSIDLELFPEQLSISDMPFELIDLIEE